MAAPMSRRGVERALCCIGLAAASAATAWLYHQYAETLPGFTHLSGWTLFFLVLALTAYNARKKLPFLPMATSGGWLRFHAFAGLFTVVVFGAHTGFRRPTGWVETVLATLYLLVTLS